MVKFLSFILLDKFKVREISKRNENNFLFNHQNKKFVPQIFLPRDFPFSVKKGYYDFSKYMFYSIMCFNIMNFLSTQALINSLGFSTSIAGRFAFSAGLNWVIKDGIGQLGSILFAAKFSHHMEANLKEWRLFANYLLNASIFMEILTLLLPTHFLIIASLANVCKN